jgi:outer membrane protein OmpA-like peptidoglycan-associated protein
MILRLAIAALAIAAIAGCATTPSPVSTAAAGPAAPTASPIDREEAALHAQLDAQGIFVTRSGNQLVINLPESLTFDADKAVLKSSFATTMTTIAGVLRQYDKTAVHVYGYTDTLGSAQHNKDLSQRRAVAVATALSSQGVDQSRFYIEGRGANDSIAPNTTDAGRAQNRRVEIQIAPLS